MATRLVGQGLLFSAHSATEEAMMVPFRTVPDSMFMLFKFMSGSQTDDDAATMEGLMIAMPMTKFIFVWFTVTSSWTLLSILTAVVSDNMISTTEKQEKLLSIANADEERAEHSESLRDLFQIIDDDRSGTLTPTELHVFLQNPKQREACAHICNVPARDVVEVLDVLFDR